METITDAFKRVPDEVKKIITSNEPATPEQIRQFIAWTKLLPDLWPNVRRFNITGQWYRRNMHTIHRLVVNDSTLPIDALAGSPGLRNMEDNTGTIAERLRDRRRFAIDVERTLE
jgi:hypothetical protein